MTISNALKTKIQQEVDELATSINSIVDTFRSMKTPLVESHEKVPRATVQLDKIADQTEDAAHRMLDKIEEITQGEEDVIKRLNQLPEQSGNALAVDSSPLKDILSQSQKNLDDVYMVMDALQFQDITTQQIQHAAALLEDVELKLQRIVRVVTGEPSDTEDKDSSSNAKPKTRVYDPHAEFQDRRADQADIDNIFEKPAK